MRILTRVVAATQVALIYPASLFLTAVLVAAGDAPQYELARIAQRIVMWYSARTWTLWVLLLAFPCAVLISGCATLLRSWHRAVELTPAAPGSLAVQAPIATLCIAWTTLTSAAILGIVVLHTLAN